MRSALVFTVTCKWLPAYFTYLTTSLKLSGRKIWLTCKVIGRACTSMCNVAMSLTATVCDWFRADCTFRAQAAILPQFSIEICFGVIIHYISIPGRPFAERTLKIVLYNAIDVGLISWAQKSTTVLAYKDGYGTVRVTSFSNGLTHNVYIVDHYEGILWIYARIECLDDQRTLSEFVCCSENFFGYLRTFILVLGSRMTRKHQ